MNIKINISVIALLSGMLFFTSCKEKKICAAYNSYFVYDDANNGYYFTSFGGPDSIPGEKTEGYFNDFGMIKKSGNRRDGDLNNIKIDDLKKATLSPDTSMMGDFDDSLGSIIKVQELFPEKVNTDQEAYDFYIGELMKEYEKAHPRPKVAIDSTDYDSFEKPENMTKEQKALWKKEKKERKRKAKEERLRKEEEGDEDDFDFDLGDL